MKVLQRLPVPKEDMISFQYVIEACALSQGISAKAAEHFAFTHAYVLGEKQTTFIQTLIMILG